MCLNISSFFSLVPVLIKQRSCCSGDFNCKLYFLRDIIANIEYVVLLRKVLLVYYN